MSFLFSFSFFIVDPLHWGFEADFHDSYPHRMLPGVDIMVCTSATNDKDARLLLSSMGVPFQGKHVN